MQINKDMLIGELLQKSDLIAPILMRAGMVRLDDGIAPILMGSGMHCLG